MEFEIWPRYGTGERFQFSCFIFNLSSFYYLEGFFYYKHSSIIFRQKNFLGEIRIVSTSKASCDRVVLPSPVRLALALDVLLFLLLD